MASHCSTSTLYMFTRSSVRHAVVRCIRTVDDVLVTPFFFFFFFLCHVQPIFHKSLFFSTLLFWTTSSMGVLRQRKTKLLPPRPKHACMTW